MITTRVVTPSGTPDGTSYGTPYGTGRRHTGSRRVGSRLVRLLCAATLLAPCAPTASAAAQARDSTLRLADNAVVDVTLRTGRLIVRGIDGESGAVRGGGRDYQLRPSGVGIVLNDRGDSRDRNRPLELDLPRGVRLVVNTASADVDLRDLRGDVEVRTMSGSLVADNLSGRLIVETLSGDVDIVGTLARLRAVTVSGDVRVRGVRGEADLRTTSGDLRVQGDGLAVLTAQSISGDLTLEGGASDQARIQMTTHSGDVTVRIPTGARGVVQVTTITGEFESGGPLTLMPGEVGNSRRGRATRRYELGGGGPLQLELSTSSGDLRLLRGTRS